MVIEPMPPAPAPLIRSLVIATQLPASLRYERTSVIKRGLGYGLAWGAAIGAGIGVWFWIIGAIFGAFYGALVGGANGLLCALVLASVGPRLVDQLGNARLISATTTAVVWLAAACVVEGDPSVTWEQACAWLLFVVAAVTASVLLTRRVVLGKAASVACRDAGS